MRWWTQLKHQLALRCLQALGVQVDKGLPPQQLAPQMARLPKTEPVATHKTSLSPPMIISRATQDAALAERVRRMICVILDLPLAQENPLLARDFINHLARASATQDEAMIEALGEAIQEAQRVWLTGEPSISGNPAAQRVSLMRNQVEVADENNVVPVKFMDARDHSVPVRLIEENLNEETESGEPHGAQAQQIAGVPDNLPFPDGRDWEAVRPLLRTICGDPELKGIIEETLAYLESLQTAADQGKHAACAPDDILLIVRNRLNRITLQLVEQSQLTFEIVEQALKHVARKTAVPFRHLRWSLAQGNRLEGHSGTGQKFSPDVDVAWTLLSQLALAKLPHTLKGTGPKIEWVLQQGNTLHTLDDLNLPSRFAERLDRLFTVELSLKISLGIGEDAPKLLRVESNEDAPKLLRVESNSDTRSSRSLHEFLKSRLTILESQSSWVAHLGLSTATLLTEVITPPAVFSASDTVRTWLKNMQRMVGGQDAESDPELAVELAGEVCRNEGTLTWEACLRLANGRARYHRYLDVTETPAQWDLVLDVHPREDGSLAIPYAVVQQPLSDRFRTQFEAQDLAGRVSILWHLVRYAQSFHTSLCEIGAATVRKQITLREDELLQLITGKLPADRQLHS